MQRSELRQQVINNTNRTDKDSVINSALDDAVRKVSSARLWEELKTEATATFTIGNNVLSLASDIRRPIPPFAVQDGLSSYKLTILSKSRVLSQFPDPTAYSLAKPRFGYFQGTTLVVVPPPDLAYNVKYTYYRIHPKLFAETDQNLITIADEAVVAYATYRTFKSLQMHTDAKEWYADYITSLSEAQANDRQPAVEFHGTPRGLGDPVPEDYWLDPFVREVP